MKLLGKDVEMKHPLEIGWNSKVRCGQQKQYEKEHCDDKESGLCLFEVWKRSRPINLCISSITVANEFEVLLN